jgi:hypothetical protein
MGRRTWQGDYGLSTNVARSSREHAPRELRRLCAVHSLQTPRMSSVRHPAHASSACLRHVIESTVRTTPRSVCQHVLAYPAGRVLVRKHEQLLYIASSCHLIQTDLLRHLPVAIQKPNINIHVVCVRKSQYTSVCRAPYSCINRVFILAYNSSYNGI